jgi:hypothetical protein
MRRVLVVDDDAQMVRTICDIRKSPEAIPARSAPPPAR